jgi:hypothetical protein
MTLLQRAVLENETRRGNGQEGVDDGIANSEAFYLSFPSPWNVLPRTTGKRADELRNIDLRLPKDLWFAGETDGSYFASRMLMIEAIHRANISVQDKLSALVRATRRDKDKMLKSIFSFASYLPSTYFKVVCDLEDYYGGDKRALDHVKNELFDGTMLVWDDIEKVAIVRSKIDTFLSHCMQHGLVGVIDNDVLTDLVLNQMFTHKQVLQYRNDCRIFQFTHPDLLRSISEWLRMRIDDLSWADGRIHSLHKSGTRKVKTKASTSALAMTH